MPHKLLLADDSVTIQRVIELTFADEDIDVTVVGDGRQAIERVRTDRPDIVLADVGMPERDGYEVAAFIKGDARLAHIPVLLLTGAFEPLDEDRARAVGCDGVLVKPFEPQTVINRVRELLSGRRPVASALAPPSPATDDIFGIDLDMDLDAPPAPPPAAAAPAKIGAAPVKTGAAAAKTGAAPAKTGDALEDYFDRLDAAFANIGGPPNRSSSKPTEPDEDLSGGISELQQPPPERTPGEDPMTSWDPDLTAGFGPAKPHLANAFAALLAAEQGQVVPQPGVALAPPPQRLSEDVIEDIVERVIARLADDAVRRTVTETAERLVREEIDRIKREARAGGGPQSGR
jgi:CheY-like chemotaxis protein